MITVVMAGSNDAYVKSNSSSYSSMTAGANLEVVSDTLAYSGQRQVSSYTGYQYMVEFPYTISAGLKAVSGFYQMYNVTTAGTNAARNTNIYGYAYGATVNTADWANPSILSGLSLRGRLWDTDKLPSGSFAYAGVTEIRSILDASSTLRNLLVTNKQFSETTPSGDEYNAFRSSRASGTVNDPQLIVGQHTLNSMTTLLAGQVQLTDGSWVVMERSTTSDSYAMLLKHRTAAGVETAIYDSGILDLSGSDDLRASQGWALVRDDSDNLFTVRPLLSDNNRVYVQGFVKGSGASWTQASPVNLSTPSENSATSIMQLVAAFHSVGSGRLVVVGVRDWGQPGETSCFYSLVDTAKLLAGNSSGAVLASGRSGDDGFIAKPSHRGRWNPLNSTGTLLDIHKDNGSEHTGYLVSGERSSILGETGALSLGRYAIHSAGDKFTSATFAEMDTNGGYAVYDPDAKARVIAAGTRQVVKISADDRTGYGLVVDHFSVGASTNSLVRLGRVLFDAETITSFPAGADLAESMAWDAIYFPVDNKVWIYYFDSADANRLMRTAVSLSDNLATQEEVEVNATVATTADTIHGIRVQRNKVTSDNVLVTVAYETSIGDHEYEYIVDRINATPTQPILTPVTNYDATAAKLFQWTFSDPNLVDNQTAYQLQIINASTSATAFDSGKVTSTTSSRSLTGSSIANNEDYLWQVRTWDVDDAVSQYSSQSSFSTSNTGVVEIVYPVADNDDQFTVDIPLDWTVTGATSDSYRVVVTRTSDSSTFLDTGWVVSAATAHTVEDLVTDTEYLFSVTARTSLVETNTATRLVTTSYSTPEIPEIVAVETSTGLEYVTVSVLNPESRGDRPNPTTNRVYRRVAGTSTKFALLGECDINGSYLDYTAASGVTYEYKVRAVEEA